MNAANLAALKFDASRLGINVVDLIDLTSSEQRRALRKAIKSEIKRRGYLVVQRLLGTR